MSAHPGRPRCTWAGDDPLMIAHHDDEWGMPLHDERRVFEMLRLEGSQAGLSWSTILRRREGYRVAYDGFDAERIAAYSDERQAELLTDERIIRNRNARATLRLRESDGGLDGYPWAWVDGQPIVSEHARLADLPAETDLSRRISKDLKDHGFGFVGPTIVQAYLQSVGVVDDHTSTASDGPIPPEGR